MKQTLAIITIGIVPVSEILPLLTDHISAEQIKLCSLFGTLADDEVMAKYAPAAGEELLLTLLSGNLLISLGKNKVEQALQAAIEVLDSQGFAVILLMSSHRFANLTARNSILLEPERIIPPLVASIVDGHQVGIIIPVPEMLKFQHKKWQHLANEPLYELANPVHGTEQELIDAGKKLVNNGADVLLLDCLGFHQKHRDLLQKSLQVPVLLSNVLIARLAAELLT
ncbi:AroM family protein [Buttiauxella warmboldiae]|uniref:AroM family protein n=1 Tax=Buttiauxella warmboldiae TaxID=82993 RepID=A0A3N5D3L8_9ENTR|nr:AroM family protein [Buttiauxella warmboldiae]RPH21875.1 AroM family protein [Buttiauxella warmboldiae]